MAWRLVTYRARNEDQNGASRIVMCQEVQFARKVSGSGGGCGFPAPERHVALPSIDYIGAGIDRTWLIGRVSPQAASVTLTLDDGRTLEAQTYRSPPSLRLPYDYYVAVESGAIATRRDDGVREVVARDAQGTIIGRARSGGQQ